MTRTNIENKKIIQTENKLKENKMRERERKRVRVRKGEKEERGWLTKVKENYSMRNPWIQSHQEGQQYIQCTQPSPSPPKHRPEVHQSDL